MIKYHVFFRIAKKNEVNFCLSYTRLSMLSDNLAKRKSELTTSYGRAKLANALLPQLIFSCRNSFIVGLTGKEISNHNVYTPD